MTTEWGVRYAGVDDVDSWGHRWEAEQAICEGDTLMRRTAATLAATVAAEIRGRACPWCGERSRRLGAHIAIDHADTQETA